MRLCTLLILPLVSTPVHSGYLDLSLASHHLQREADGFKRNEKNYGLGLTTDSLAFGFYRNSYYKTSLYFAGNVEARYRYGTFGLLYGVVTGYEEKVGHDVIPMLLPYFAFGTPRYRVRVGVTPVVTTLQLQVGGLF